MQIVFLGDICIKCQSLFSGKNKKNISKCRLLKFLPSILSVNGSIFLLELAASGSASYKWTDEMSLNKAQFVADDILIFYLLSFFSDNKTWHFM